VKRGEGPAPARLSALAAQYRLDAAQQGQLRDFLALLSADPHAPTAIRDPVEAIDVHLADSLVALPCLDDALAAGSSERVVDLGSGAGLPALPLAVARPATRFDLVEANRRRCGFISGAVEQLGLHNVQVVCARAEEVPGQGARESYGAVLARALASLPTLAEYAGPLLARGGRLLAWKGRPAPAEERAGAGAAAQVGLDPLPPVPVTPYPGSRNRRLYLYRKVSPCSPRFPRRPGRARKNPLA
jgi:16S rRNA (guanine527-N7)-methyltransferase